MASLSPDTRLELDREGFLWVLWEGDVVAYDRLSGDSHRFYAPAGRVIAALQDSSGSLRWDEILAAGKSDAVPEGSHRVAVETAAESLISTGLLQYSIIVTP